MPTVVGEWRQSPVSPLGWRISSPSSLCTRLALSQQTGLPQGLAPQEPHCLWFGLHGLHPLKCPAPTLPHTVERPAGARWPCGSQLSAPLGRPGSELRGVRSARVRLVCVRSNYVQPWARGRCWWGSCPGASQTLQFLHPLKSLLVPDACDKAACHEWCCGVYRV